ncbi:hypothetical protein [Bacillus sp. AK128]
MGYILPITRHEYTQYANRMLKTGASPFVLPQVAKVSLEKRLNDQTNHEQFEFEASEEHNITAQSTTKQQVKPTLNYQLISKITGKGRNIDEAI